MAITAPAYDPGGHRTHVSAGVHVHAAVAVDRGDSSEQDCGLSTAEGDGGQATPLQRRSPFTPDAVAGGIGDSLWSGTEEAEAVSGSVPARLT